MTQYIEFVADRLIFSLGYPKKYETKNPFDWMNMIGMEGKANFFEKKVGDYQRAGIAQKKSGNADFSLNTEF